MSLKVPLSYEWTLFALLHLGRHVFRLRWIFYDFLKKEYSIVEVEIDTSNGCDTNSKINL